MGEFLKAIPAAAAHPYALAAYAIAGVLLLLAGQNLRRLQLVLARLNEVPAAKRREVIEIATNTKLPESITAEQWIRLTRLRLSYLLAAAVLICTMAVVTIAMVREKERPPNLQLHDITR